MGGSSDVSLYRGDISYSHTFELFSNTTDWFSMNQEKVFIQGALGTVRQVKVVRQHVLGKTSYVY